MDKVNNDVNLSEKINVKKINGLDVNITKNYHDMSEWAAYKIINTLSELLNHKAFVVLVPSAGDTVKELYKTLIGKYSDSVDWARVIVIQMDEYLGVAPEDPHSLANFLLTNLIQPLGIQKYTLINDSYGNLQVTPDEYEQVLKKNGIDIVIHGVGENGHLGFNEPDSKFDTATRLVELTRTTIESNARHFGNILSDVPTKGITIGLSSIISAKNNFLLASGKKKNSAVKSALYGSVSSALPASVLRLNPSTSVILDEAAFS